MWHIGRASKGRAKRENAGVAADREQLIRKLQVCDGRDAGGEAVSLGLWKPEARNITWKSKSHAR